MVRVSPRLLGHLLLLLLLSPFLPVQAQTASLVADLSPQADPSWQSSLPGELFAFKGRLFFSAREPGSGYELWISDGQGRGTHLLADFCPGRCDSNPHILGSTSAAVLGVTSFQVGFDDLALLWRSDGTRQGTFLLPSAADPVEMGNVLENPPASLGNVLYFSGCNDAQSCGLWRSDGTPAGTRAVKVFGSNDGVDRLAVAGSRLFFLHDRTLWVTDGTTGGTRTVQDLPFGARLPTGLGNRVVFLSGDNTTGQELWTTDGTAAGTRALTSFAAQEPFPQTLFFKPLGGKLYFVVDDLVHGAELWATDGTLAGTRQVTEIGFHNPFAFNEIPFDETGLRATDLEILGNRVVFWATDGIHGFQPWSTAGTPESTTPLCPSCSFTNDRAALVKVGSRLLFTGRDAQHGAEVWATDGTPQGTILLKDVCSGSCNGARSDPLPLLGSAFFSAFDPRGSALWVSDGTPAGTRRFAVPGAYVNSDSLFRASVAALGSTVFYAGDGPDDDYGIELWASNGTPAGTRLVTDVARGNASTHFEALTAVGRNLFFSTCGQGNARRFWYTEGTAESTKDAGDVIACGSYPIRGAGVAGAMLFPRNEYYENRDQLWRMDADGTLTQLTQMPGGFHIGDFAVLGGKLYFAVINVNNDLYLIEIWRSDGTAQGTAKVADLPAALHNPYFFTVVGSEIWFLVDDFDQRGGSEIWRTDDTPAGTRRTADLGENRTVTDPEFTRIGSTVFFVGADADSHRQIWKSDGTPAGSAMVRDLDPDPFDDFSKAVPADLVALQGSLYFSAKTPQGRSGLWRTDGTAQGTVLVKDFVDPDDPLDSNDDYDSQYYPSPLDLAVVGSWLVFAADDGHGRELWRSDGTAAGTTVLRDLTLSDSTDDNVGPTFFQPAAGRLFFTADDGIHGFELWQTDGTPEGTRMVQDIAPEGASSYPEDLTLAGDRLFFSADDGTTGQELWVLPLTGPPCQPSAVALCLAGGRFEVKVSWRDFAGRTGSGHAVPLSGDTGYFWFFDAANVETVVKVLDGTAANGHFWVFFGALTNVEYTLTVTDTRTGATRRYFNPKGVFASVGDTQGFGPLGAYDTQAVAAAGTPPLVAERVVVPAATGTCVPAAGRLCLNGGRFAVEASWKDFSNHTGTGTAVPLTGDTGYFWFFDAANVEVAIKVLDATAANGHFWLFYGALSNVEYTLTVTDTMTGKVKTYKNPKGRFASVGDTGAF